MVKGTDTEMHMPSGLSGNNGQLAYLLRPALNLPIGQDAKESARVTIDLAHFAERRHRVAPLLYGALKRHSDIVVESAASEYLDSSYRKNAPRRLMQKAAAKKICHILLEAGIAFWPIKGEGFAHQLYDDPNMRWANDIDILINPADARRAIALLHSHGYRASHARDGAYKPRPFVEHIRMQFHKDEGYRDPDYGQLIELHQRLFYFEPAGLTAKLHSKWQENTPPRIDCEATLLYLLLHGAMTRWGRMKWLADMSLAVRNINRPMLMTLMELARACFCGHAILASLWWVEQVFPGSLKPDVSEEVVSCYLEDSAALNLVTQFEYMIDESREIFTTRFSTPAWDIFKSRKMRLFVAGYIPLAAAVRKL